MIGELIVSFLLAVFVGLIILGLSMTAEVNEVIGYILSGVVATCVFFISFFNMHDEGNRYE
jgi:hypothetical protein